MTPGPDSTRMAELDTLIAAEGDWTYDRSGAMRRRWADRRQRGWAPGTYGRPTGSRERVERTPEHRAKLAEAGRKGGLSSGRWREAAPCS